MIIVNEPIRVKTITPGEVFRYTAHKDGALEEEGYYMATSRIGLDPLRRFCVNLKTGTFLEFDFEAVIKPVNVKLVVLN